MGTATPHLATPTAYRGVLSSTNVALAACLTPLPSSPLPFFFQAPSTKKKGEGYTG